MRIARLDLVRYGRFSDHTLDFGPPPVNGPDFHIVYGLNEAGKSTAAAAILDLLFGIDERSQYGAAKGRASVPNWHAYNTMRVGARLDLSSGAVEIARVKRDRNSLIDADMRPLDEAFLKAELAGVDRNAFRMMYSLDDGSLEEGGDAILASRGDLGELLFSASAGVAEMSARLEKLREKIADFHRPRASTTELAKRKHELEDLRREREQVDTIASAYAELVRRRDEAKAAYDAAAGALGRRRARAGAIERLLAGLPRLAALHDAEPRLARFVDLPTPPLGWGQELAKLQAEAIRLDAQLESAETAVQAIEDDLSKIERDPAALAQAFRVDGWRELRSRYDTAKDIPAREAERDGKRAVVQDILRRLGRDDETDPAKLILSARTVGTLEELMASRSGVEAKLVSAREAAETAKAALDDALAEAPEPEGDAVAIEALKGALVAARRDDSEARLDARREEMDKQARKLSDILAALAPWQGMPEQLSAVSVPSETETVALRERLSRTEAERRQSVTRLKEKTAEAERLKAEAAAAARGMEAVGDDAAADFRADREAAWAAHRASLTASSADAFEAALRRDDAASAARLANARELASLRERATIVAGLEAERLRAKADLEAAEAALDLLRGEIAGLSPVAAPIGRDPLSVLDVWRARRDEAMALMSAMRDIKEAMRRLELDAERTRTALVERLRAAGAPHEPEAALPSLIERAEAAIGRLTRTETLRQKARERRADLSRAEARLKAAVDEDARWRGAWRQALLSSGLNEGDCDTAIGPVRQALKALEDLRLALKDTADLDHRIAAMERDRRLFADEVAAVAAALGMGALGMGADGDAARLADALATRVAKAREHERRREEKAKGLAAAREKRAALVEALAVNRKLGSAMTSLFTVETLSEVAGKLEACKARDALREDIAKETRAIIALNLASSLDEALTALASADRPALEQELTELKAREADDEAAREEGYAAWREASRRLEAVGGDDAVLRIEEKRRTVLEEIKDGARRYLALRAGVVAAEQALALYRDRHRGAMMERASKAFSEISRGAYRGLTTQPNGESETLIALARDGGSKEAQQLSKGARFQLYLALRVAGYHELAKTRIPAPFVADDIMETFDHFRAEEALKLFAEMGRVGQVIYMTHHLHLAEIAQKVCPEARVHELAA